MLILDNEGYVIYPEDDLFYEALKPFQEAQRREVREGPCEDDTVMVAPLIEDAVRYERDYFGHIDRLIQQYLCSGNMYPERLHDGPPGLPYGGILTNKRGRD